MTTDSQMLKCTLAQINTIVGDIDGNFKKALAAHRRAVKKGSHLIVFPEQTFLGYPAKDLLLQKDLIARNEEAAQNYAIETANGPASIVGFSLRHTGEGTGLFNVAALCRNGLVETIYKKRLLPTYDVFDEDRYFDEANEVCVVDINGHEVGITICEDIWNDALLVSHRLYQSDPLMETAQAGTDLIVNLSASPYTIDKRLYRRQMISGAAQRNGVGIIQVNLVGANDDLIFDGSSLAVSPDGTLAAAAKAFEEDQLEVVYRKNKHGILMGKGRG